MVKMVLNTDDPSGYSIIGCRWTVKLVLFFRLASAENLLGDIQKQSRLSVETVSFHTFDITAASPRETGYLGNVFSILSLQRSDVAKNYVNSSLQQGGKRNF